jgi:deoxyribonuclease V
MAPKVLHSWDVDPHEAILIQKRLREQLTFDPRLGRIRLVGAGDVSYGKRGDRLFGAMVVFSFPDLALMGQAWEVGRVNFPYSSGLLSFRECPVLLQVSKRIDPWPDVWIFDGQGIAHPREMGLASHMGLLLGCPSIGCAKKRLLGRHDPVGPRKGDFELLRFEEHVVGAVLRTRRGTKPVYVSPGFRIGLDGALDLILKTTTRYRMPEPLRQAHLLSKRIRQKSEVRSQKSGEEETNRRPFDI